nr:MULTISPECIES: GNAT family N-acetyltransferase [unclassified Ornithinimicrobium]
MRSDHDLAWGRGESVAQRAVGGEGWGIIGTHIHPEAGRTGLGRRLFATSLAAAKAAGLRHIDASIGSDNSAALAYYAAMGFTPHREGSDTIPHRFDVP